MKSTESGIRAATLAVLMLAGTTPTAHGADPAGTAAVPTSPSANIAPSIPFADHGGIFDWRADGRRGIWLQDVGRKWYYGTFMTPCDGLEFADAVAFRTNPSGSFDRWSTVLVHDGIACRLASFTASVGPPDGSRDLALESPAPPTPEG